MTQNSNTIEDNKSNNFPIMNVVLGGSPNSGKSTFMAHMLYKSLSKEDQDLHKKHYANERKELIKQDNEPKKESIIMSMIETKEEEIKSSTRETISRIVQEVHNDATYIYNFWDVPGQDISISQLAQGYYFANVVIIFINAAHWRDELNSTFTELNDVPLPFKH